ncbi:hypothetical protein [Streptomyces sp. NPDC002758]
MQVVNGSDDPITDVYCEARGMPALNAIEVAPGEGVGTGIFANLIQGTRAQHVQRLGVGREAWFQVVSTARGVVHIEFTDAAGNKRILDDAGDLRAAP